MTQSKVFDFSNENILKISKMIIGFENNLSSSIYSKECSTTGFFVVIIRDILEYIGAIIDKPTEPNRIYSNLLYESERIKVLIDKLRQIRETVTQMDKNRNEEL